MVMMKNDTRIDLINSDMIGIDMIKNDTIKNDLIEGELIKLLEQYMIKNDMI
ncbi:hypothetical protein II582_04675 [bacterium]|jgi:hypothetical protein|nr:hypothetical protein [bacterium]